MGEEPGERRANNMEVENIIIGMTKEPVIMVMKPMPYMNADEVSNVIK